MQLRFTAAPQILKRAPQAFDPAGLVITRHEAISSDGTRIPYVQAGPPGETGEAPVHLTGYGGFGISMPAYYNPAIGKLWLERGGTSVSNSSIERPLLVIAFTRAFLASSAMPCLSDGAASSIRC